MSNEKRLNHTASTSQLFEDVSGETAISNDPLNFASGFRTSLFEDVSSESLRCLELDGNPPNQVSLAT
eukprot:1599723-Pyramimonas_sp.AAC.1